MGLGDLESVILTFGTDNRREGVLVMSRVSERSELETSDSEKLLVLDNDVAKLLTELTRSALLTELFCLQLAFFLIFF